MTRLLPLLAALAAMAVLVLPSGVRAQSVDPVLVSNTGQTAGTDLATAENRVTYAQSFTTGNHPDGYFLSSVDVGLNAASGVSVELSLWWSELQDFSPPRGHHYRPLHSLTPLSGVSSIDDNSSTLERFTAHDVLLLPDTTYWIVVTRTGGADDGLSVATTESEGAVDAGGMDGFSIGNNVWARQKSTVIERVMEGDMEVDRQRTIFTWLDYSSDLDAGMKIQLRGSEATRPPGPYATNRNQQPRSSPAETSSSISRYATSFYTDAPTAVFGVTSYEVTSVLLSVAAETGVTPRVAIHADNGNRPAANPLTNGVLIAPADVSRDLAAPDRAEFTASPTLSLATDTRYWVVLDVGSGSGKVSVSTTKDNREDLTAYVEHQGASNSYWTIGNAMKIFDGSQWSDDSDRRSFRMALNGTTDPTRAGIVNIGLPQVGVGVRPVIADPAGRFRNESWQWQRGETREGSFTDIPAAEGGTSRIYTPSTADLGKWLKANVSYDDAFGPGNSATGVTPQPVLSQPVVSNAGRPPTLGYVLAGETELGPVSVAEAFTTGGDAGGYLLRGLRFGIAVFEEEASSLTWALHADDDGQPAAAPLFAPIAVPNEDVDRSSETLEELVHPGFLLEADTTYWAVLTSSPLPAFTVRFGKDSYSVDESGSVEVTIILSADLNRTVEIPITTINQGEASDSDYSGVPPSVTFEAGETEKSFTFTPFDDDLDDDGESVRLAFGHIPDGQITPWPQDATTIIIVDDDAPEVSVSFGSAVYTAAEGGVATVTVTLSEDPERTVAIPLTKTDQGDTSNDDYSFPTSVTFNSGETSKTLAFTANADEAEDDGESVLIEFGTLPHDVTEGTPTSTTVTIYAAPVTVSFGAAAYSVVEGGGVAVSLQLSEAPNRTVTIPLIAINEGGVSNSDYSEVPADVTFNSGETTKTFTLTATADHLAESGESVKLALGPLPSGIAIGSQAETTVSLSDGSTPESPTVHFGASTYSVGEGESVDVTVTLSKAPGSDAVVPFTVTPRGGAGDLDYSGVPDSVTFGAEETEKAFTFMATQDSVDDNGESVVLGFGTLNGGITATEAQASESSVSITDDDSRAAAFGLSAISEDGHHRVFDRPTPELDPGGAPDWTFHYSTRSLIDPALPEWSYYMTDLQLTGRSVLRMSVLTYPEVTASLAVDSTSVDEGDTATVTVTLDKDPERTVVIPIATTHQDGASTDDYSIPTSVTFESGDTEKTITFTAEQDDIDDDGESVTLGFGELPPSVLEGETTEATVSITDDDTAGVTISKTALEIEEGSSDTYTVVLDSEPTADVTVSAQGFGGSDLAVNPQGVTFTADNWNMARAVTVTAQQDRDSVDDVVTITHRTSSTDPNYHNATVGSVVVTTTDNDKPGVEVTFGSSTYTAAEGDDVSVTVTLDRAPERSLTIPIDPTNQGTTTDADYMVPTSVTFNSTETSKTITFTANQDTENDDNESVVLDFGELPDGVTEGTPSSTTVSITDDDVPQVVVTFGQNSYTAAEGETVSVVVELDKQPERTVTIPVRSINQGTTSNGDYSVPTSVTFNSTETSKTITFTANQDTEDDDNESVLLDFGTLPTGVTEGTPSSTTVSITDDDVPQVEVSFGSSTYTTAEGGTVSVVVELDKAPERSLTIPVRSTNQGTTTNADYSVPNSVTFNSSETSKSITFTANQDTEDDDNESVLLDFGTLPTGVTEGSPSSTTVSITDDDHPQVEVRFGSSTYTADEGDTVSITVTLDKAPERSVTIPIDRTNQGTTTNADYSMPTSVTFNSAETSKTITFTAEQDDIDDDGESVVLGFGVLPTGVTEGTPSSTTVSITDNDTAGVTISKTALEIQEGSSDTYTVVLDSEPTADVTVNVQGFGGSDLSVNPQGLTFTADNWNMARTVTVTAQQDQDSDDDVVTITHATTSTDPNYHNATVGSVVVTTTDDDPPVVQVRFGSSTYTATEGNTVSITITLDKQPERTVTIPIDATNQGTTSADYDVPTSVTFGSTETSKTITFTANDDTVDDDGESVLLAFGTLPTDVTEGSPSSTTVSITDDDGTPTAITLSVNPASIGEADGETDVTVTATLVGSSTRTTATTVTLSLSGTAADPRDYAVTTALTSVTIPAGQSSGSGTLTVTPVADAVVEGDETVVVDGAAVGFTVSSATITMEDDDEATLSISGPSSDVSEGADATFTVTLSHAVDESVQVAWSAPGTGVTAVAGDLDSTSGSVTFPANSAAGATRTITIRAVDDMLSEQAETFTVTLGTITSGRSDRVSLATGAASASATIAESDPVTVQITGPATVAEGGQATYTVSLSPSGVTPTADLTVDYATVDGTATAGSDYTQKSGTLTFTQASPGEQTFTVQTLQDSLDDDDETFTASISNPQGGGGPTPTLSATDSSVTTTITDDDHPQVEVTFGSSTYTAAEGDDVSVTVTLDRQPERTVTIPVRSTNQGTTTNGDYDVPTSVTFGSAETSKSITFTANQDTEDDDNESVLLDFGTLPTGVSEGSPSSTTVSITDDDVPQVKVSFGSSTYTAAEGDSVSITVTLDNAPERSLSIPIDPTNQGTTTDADYMVPTSVTFNSTETSKTITFTANDDTEDDDGESVLLDFGTLPTGVTEGTPSSTTVSITDDDITVVPTTDCEDGGVYCGVLDFRAVKDFAEGRKELERNSLDIDEFTYNGVTYGVGVVLLSPEPRGIVEPGPPFAIPERATILLTLTNLSAENPADRFTMPNEDWKDWMLYLSTEVDGETLQAALPFSEAKFISGRKWRWYGLDLDRLNAAWTENRPYELLIVEDPVEDREPEVTGPPLYLESRGSNPNNVLLSWVKPQTRNDDPPPGVTYKVQWRPLGESSWHEYVYQPTPDEEWVTWTLRELESGASYEVRVIATTEAGDSEPSNVLTVTTKG